MFFAGLITLLCAALLLVRSNSGSNNFVISGSFLVIIFYAAFETFRDTTPYSFNKMFWIFNLVFMGVVPLFQYTQHNMAWDEFFPDAIFIKTNLLLLVCLAAYSAIRTSLSKRPLKLKASPPVNGAQITPKAFLVGFCVFLICCSGIIFTYGFSNIWHRQDAELSLYQNIHPTLALLLDKGLRGVTMYFSLLSIWLFRKKQIALPWLLTVLFCCVFVNFPLSLARYYAACLYLSLLLAFHLKWLEKKNVFAILLTVGLLIVFPALSLTRYAGEELTTHTKNLQSIYASALVKGDFDAYTSVCKTYQYIANHDITWGRQLLTVILFFVPRSIWPGKSIGSGALIYEPSLENFHNYTSAYYAEGLINFGAIGAVLFIMGFAIAGCVYDRWYARMKSSPALHFGVIFYPVAMIMSFFILRGDLLSSFAYLAGFFISASLLHQFLRRLSKSA
ncbi:oligosaccharide repeat unit polymerase [Taibaiella soli]|uniref:oligosaccharide repeat unit polymerase n=1 Tax=Taibaiella soli TaxID=1649169 RepID=UPI000F503475|nr:oligosaccharide repeat unit polymerase [Taibaiella soli]